MNTLLNDLKEANNFGYTENGARTYKSTMSGLCDLFAFGAAYRSRSDEDRIMLFKKAYDEDPTYALKCLFYLRDVRGGQGERCFFRVCVRWLALYDEDAVRRNLQYFPEYGRYDDWFVLFNTNLENDILAMIKHQLALDMESYRLSPKQGISLLAKWLPSENASSAETAYRAAKIRKYLNMTARQYRKTLSALRERINVLERLMSANKWDEIEFDKIPSKAGFKYRNAFARHDIERAKSEKNAQTYKDFVKDETKTVNADALNPVDIADQIFSWRMNRPTATERAAWDKYWSNLKDYYQGNEEPGIAICDVSGSMIGQPMNAAVSMSAYIAERGKGPFQNHFITFSNNPQLVEFEGVDIYDKFHRAQSADWSMSTNVEAAMDLLLSTALKNNVPAEDMPKTLYIFSDMEYNACMSCGPASSPNRYYGSFGQKVDEPETLFETIAKRWSAHGYELPRVIFWNLNARNNRIPAMGSRFSYVSGFSMNMVETILSGKDGWDLVRAKLDSERYSVIN